MSTPGPLPYCLHCRWLRGDLPNPFECTHHDIRLPNPVRVFCTIYADRTPLGAEDWLDRTHLNPALLYVWVETVTRDAEGQIEHHYDAVPLTTLASYDQWTRDQFLQEVRQLMVKQQAVYRRQGYQIHWVE
jgi:hypothetical protein